MRAEGMGKGSGRRFCLPKPDTKTHTPEECAVRVSDDAETFPIAPKMIFFSLFAFQLPIHIIKIAEMNRCERGISNLLNFSSKREFQIGFGCLRESVSKLVCDWEGLGGRGGEEVHDDSIKNKEEKLRKGVSAATTTRFEHI
jgi:hypothetical protein